MIKVKRLPKELVDSLLSQPPPQPPTKKVTVWGGVEEAVPDFDNPAYQQELQFYALNLREKQWELIHAAVEVDREPTADELAELEAVGLTDWLRYIVLTDPQDVARVIDEILYLSTVTERGIEEAERRFAVTWNGQPVSKYKIPGTPGAYGSEFEQRKAARFCGLTWQQFCELPGPEQSAIVAYMRCEMRLEWLLNQK